MEKPEQILRLEPQHELKFRGPFTSPVTVSLTLTNPTERRVCFKIKTTAPKKYCVRPNCGIVEPNGMVEVAVCLQPFEFDPNMRTKHKFMVLSMFAPEGEREKEAIWKDVDPNKLMDTKLDCVFEWPKEMQPESEVSIVKNDGEYVSGDSPVAEEPNVEEMEEVLKASIEMKRLQEDARNLQLENQRLKEELAELQTLSPSFPPRESNMESSHITHILQVMFAAFAAIVGYIIGQYHSANSTKQAEQQFSVLCGRW